MFDHAPSKISSIFANLTQFRLTAFCAATEDNVPMRQGDEDTTDSLISADIER